jgi:hypothetical protein
MDKGFELLHYQCGKVKGVASKVKSQKTIGGACARRSQARNTAGYRGGGEQSVRDKRPN